MDRGADQVAAQGRAVDEHDLDQEIQAMKRHVLEMEAQLHHFPINVQWPHGPRQHQPRAATAVAIDDNSIYIGQVDYSTTAEDLVALFHRCGPIMRVTVVCDKATGQPKGYAYIEFATPDAAQSALALNETPFRGRQIKVTTKRAHHEDQVDEVADVVEGAVLHRAVGAEESVTTETYL
ncbi:hypothetical protein H310_02892 [Aphanomyces invadans]|uniref:RRM domain-containing protein n=1 Tax=Aphanomyces invadans TaxID=157072 RepID=A0A024UK81_9STRA|nr:hypothetical protein H310_02892 [Aphanomyces invadans]ETW06714.1 hypothetical protein H310_02892 [Aphanomyces invadans]|eukprot:XP_008864789.1 hypothetical protein H310_02892 [Aphanomyces invadans]